MATRSQTVFARNWPLKTWLVIGATFGATMAVRACEPTRSAFSELHFSALLIASIVLGGIAGFFCAVALAPLLLPPLYWIQEHFNGAPFRRGDYVKILVGQHQDIVAPVYEIWHDRHQLRVDLGADAKHAITDLFSYVQVCRVTTAEPDDARERPSASVLNGQSITAAP
jgi:hypothetical protein